MSLQYGPERLAIDPVSPAQVSVTDEDGQPAPLASPISIENGWVSFTVTEPGRYWVRVDRGHTHATDVVSLSNAPNYDITYVKSYVDAELERLEDDIDEIVAGEVDPALVEQIVQNYLQNNNVRSNVLVLEAGEAIPDGTPNETVIVRYSL